MLAFDNRKTARPSSSSSSSNNRSSCSWALAIVSGFFLKFLLLAILHIYIYIYIYYFYAPEDIQFGEKLWNHPIKPHFRPLLGHFVTTFRSPRFPFFSSPRAPPSFFLTHPDQSVTCSDYNTLQIVYANFF